MDEKARRDKNEKGEYLGLGIALGLSLGAAVGMIINNVGLGAGMGLLWGIVIAELAYDAKKKKRS
jgi:hypothetical protein